MPDKDKIFNINTSIDPEQVLNRAWAVQRAKEDYQIAFNKYLQEHPIPTVSNIGYNLNMGVANNPEAKRQEFAHNYAVQQSRYNPGDPTQPYKDTDKIASNVYGTVAFFAPEFGAGILPGVARIVGGTAGSWLNSRVGRMAGSAIDGSLGTHWIEPTLEIAGALGGWSKGEKLANLQFIQHKPIIGQISRFQSPLKAITSGRTYQAPQTTIKSAFPQMAYTADFSGVENIDAANFGYKGVKPNLGLRKLLTERRSKQLLDSVAEEEKRNAAALKYMGSDWTSLSPTNQYWLGVNYGDKWNDKLIVPRLGTATISKEKKGGKFKNPLHK